MQNMGFESGFIGLKFLDATTASIPPQLPAVFQTCILMGVKRLTSKQIYCISPNKLIVAGRANTIVFDKTGTLTEQNLRIKSHETT